MTKDSTTKNNKVYTPNEVAKVLKLSDATVYKLIKDGEIIAKKFGNVYRIPESSLSFIFTGLDFDLLQADQIDKQQLTRIHKELNKVRKSI